MPPDAEPLVSAREVGVRFGGLRALGSLTFTIAPGELLGIIGPNGAGKTTLFHVMSGVVAPTQGRLRVDGADLTGLSPQIFCRRGVARTFQTPRVFRASSALDNVAFGVRFARRHSGDVTGRARALLDRVDLGAFGETLAGALPPARQRMLEIAMALGTGPRLLLLDEVAAGLTDAEADRVSALVRALHAELGIAVAWIEHAVGRLMRTVDRMLVLDHGDLIADGAPAAVAADKRVIDAYLGTDQETSQDTSQEPPDDD
ncbi:MAG TPA: ATP-binding cassette domain-containing protein [Polyangia bacterium]|jgi:branched-chain amino acid transport system ATP-binding protein|nr:ATP-binding cassette domain-containing protein [Polyangia bacterium]